MTRRPDPFLAAERAVSRWARLLRDVQDLTLEGTVEPRKWIGCAERFWLGMAEDAGDWLRLLAVEPDSGTDAETDVSDGTDRWMTPEDHVIPVNTRTHEIDVHVPLAIFETLGVEEVTLRLPGLQAGEQQVIASGRNLLVLPSRIGSADPNTKIRLFDLPTFHTGTKLWGLMWAVPDGGERASIPVCEIRIAIE